MFDELKGFVRGWRDAGRFPEMSPELARPYSMSVLRFLEDGKTRARVKELVCDKYNDWVPFEFSWDVLPFSIASTFAVLKGGGDKTYQQFIDTMLDQMTIPLEHGFKRERFAAARVLTDTTEWKIIYELLHAAGVGQTPEEYEELELPWSVLVGAVFPIRREFNVSAIGQKFNGGDDPLGQILEFSHMVARHVLKNCTGFPTPAMESAIVPAVFRMFGELVAVPHYRRRA